MVKLLAALVTATTVVATTNFRQQQFKVCNSDKDCNSGFYCLPTWDGTFAMCQPGNPPAQRNFVCTDHADYYGDDLSNTHTGYQGCVYNCRINPDCNAIAWVQDANGQQGMCYYKHLKDINRQPTSDSRAIKTCKDTPDAPKKVKWVADAGYQVKGDDISTKSNVASVEACESACEATPSCIAVSYIKNSQSCTLKKTADNYYPVWSKAVDLGAVAAFSHTYSACYSNYDYYNQGDVTNFQGSFQDCKKCFDKGGNAFTWYLGPITGMAQPVNPQGTCYCKKVTPPTPIPATITPNAYGGTVFCFQ
ncbi:hypothetical protein THRCLA_05109 [Thraustotheca clavata]|uniref:Secreted protein n=1 Tax=Thraustotheca clavata TaxID=74557 RepID=A0A0A7CM27_9STRA|nr:secreted protein [Thraustotheca clavata]OQS02520.1 hypothetical protein THRCLA_05109 [Thraustotheca clavata]